MTTPVDGIVRRDQCPRGAIVESRFSVPNAETLPRDPAWVFRYWEEKRNDRIGPAWGDFRLVDLPASLIPWSAVVDVEMESLDFVFRFFGTARTVLHGKDFTGKSVLEVQPTTVTEKVFQEYQWVYENQAPLYIFNEGYSQEDGDFRYEFLRLPLSSDGKAVDKIYAVGFSGDQPEAEVDYWRE